MVTVSLYEPAAEPNHRTVGTFTFAESPVVGDVINLVSREGGPVRVDERVWLTPDRVRLVVSRC